MTRLRTINNYNISNAGNITLNYLGEKYILESLGGSSDVVQLFRNGNFIFVLDYNESFGYAGISVFNLENLELSITNKCGMENSVFFQDHQTHKENLDLKKDLLEYSEINIAKILLEHLGE